MVNLLVPLIKLKRLAKLDTLQLLTTSKRMLADPQSHGRCLDLSESDCRGIMHSLRVSPGRARYERVDIFTSHGSDDRACFCGGARSSAVQSKHGSLELREHMEGGASSSARAQRMVLTQRLPLEH